VTRSITRLFLSGAAAATLALAGCSAGMISQTADQVAPVPGVSANLDAQTGDGQQVSVRDVAFAYAGVVGYPAGGNAPLQARLFNETAGTVTFSVKVDPAYADSVTLVGGQPKPTANPEPAASPSAAAQPSASTSAGAGPSGSASASPQASAGASAAPSAAPKAEPVKIVIPSGSFVSLDKIAGTYLQVNGLKKALTNGGAIPLIFTVAFGDGAVVAEFKPLTVPVTTPLDEGAPRVTVVSPHAEGEQE
jgi:hypothetical protein